MESKQTRKPPRLDPLRHGTNLGVRANVRFIRMTQFRPRRNVWPRRRRLVVPRFDYDRGRRIHTRYQALQIHDPLPPALIAHSRAHSLARARVYVLVRFDRTRCLQGAVAWRCRAGRSGVAKIGRREGRMGRGRGLWIDIVTGVSSGFLGGATERVSRQTLGPMYQLNPARNAFAGTVGKRRVSVRGDTPSSSSRACAFRNRRSTVWVQCSE